MPFSIHCSGNDHFLYAEGYVSSVGDLFDIQTATGRIAGGVTAPVSTLAEESRDAALPEYDAFQAGMTAQDNMLGNHFLDDALVMAMTSLSSLHISVNARNPGWILTDSAFASTIFYQGDGDCIFQFMRDIGPALTATGLNGGAVLRQFALAIEAFHYAGCDSLPRGHHAPADFMLIFQLSVI